MLGAAIHPRLRYRVVRIGRMDGKTWLENAILYPAHKKFFLRCRAVKSANVTALICHTGKSHAKNGRNVVFQAFPAGQIVPCPGLRIALNACMTGTAHSKGSGIWKSLMDGFLGQLAHEVAHDRLDLPDRSPFSLKEHAGILIHKPFVFAVVIPDGSHTVRQEIFL